MAQLLKLQTGNGVLFERIESGVRVIHKRWPSGAYQTFKIDHKGKTTSPDPTTGEELDCPWAELVSVPERMNQESVKV